MGLDLVITSKHFVVEEERGVVGVGRLAPQALNERAEGVGRELLSFNANGLAFVSGSGVTCIDLLQC